MKKTMNYQYTKVDGEKLSRILDERGLTQMEVSAAIGYSKNYIDNSIAWGRISKAGSIALEHMFGIKPEDYAPDEKPVVEEPVEELQAIEAIRECGIDYDKLFDVIKRAVVEALNS